MFHWIPCWIYTRLNMHPFLLLLLMLSRSLLFASLISSETTIVSQVYNCRYTPRGRNKNTFYCELGAGIQYCNCYTIIPFPAAFTWARGLVSTPRHLEIKQFFTHLLAGLPPALLYYPVKLLGLLYLN